jgi:hypothetical protein
MGLSTGGSLLSAVPFVVEGGTVGGVGFGG